MGCSSLPRRPRQPWPPSSSLPWSPLARSLRCEHTLQRSLEYFVYRVHPPELEALPQHVGEVLEVGLVAPRRDHALDPEALRGQRLLLQPADREHLPGERDLARHG